MSLSENLCLCLSMTVTGLPVSLEKCLGTLLQDNALTSWRIFSSESGEQTVTIKLHPHSETRNGDQQAGQSIGGWYRKGQAKTRRDRERWQAYQARLGTDTKHGDNLYKRDTELRVDTRNAINSKGLGLVCSRTDSKDVCVVAEQDSMTGGGGIAVSTGLTDSAHSPMLCDSFQPIVRGKSSEMCDDRNNCLPDKIDRSPIGKEVTTLYPFLASDIFPKTNTPTQKK